MLYAKLNRLLLFVKKDKQWDFLVYYLAIKQIK